MARSLVEYLEGDMECEGLLECLHGLTELDRRTFQVLVRAGEPMTVDELVEGVDRERSTVYRSVQRLLSAGLVTKEQVNYEHGGYCHVYGATDAEDVAADMRQLLDDWYAEMERLVAEFEARYEDPAPVSAED